MELHPLEVPVEQLRVVCDPATLDFETTEEVAPLEGTVGQDRALNAIEFGLHVRTEGYNIFVAGVNGAGRNATVRACLSHLACTQPRPSDWCYVHNFDDPHHPKALRLPAGAANKFAQEIDQLIGDCRADIPKVFETEDYQAKRAEIGRALQGQREAILREIQEEAARRGFAIETTQAGIATVPVVGGKPMQPEQFEALADETKASIGAAGEELRVEIAQALARAHNPEKEAVRQVEELDRSLAMAAVRHHFERLAGAYAPCPDVVEHLRALQEDVLRRLSAFRGQDQQTDGPAGQISAPHEDALARYKVNVFVANSGDGAPIVVEHNPSYYNLCGRVDYKMQFGTMVADFSTVKPGAIHHANGGYLVIQARDLLGSPLSWDALKRVLRGHELRVENVGEQYSPVPAASLKPDPIPVSVKVILIGHPATYYLLYHQDEEFRKMFKVKADFGPDMPRNEDHISKYAAFIAAHCRRAELRHFHRSAVAKVVDYGSRLLDHQEKLSTRFIDVADLIEEAAFWAEREGAASVMGGHVEKAIAEKTYRANLIEERVQEQIVDGTVMIDTSGAVVGQVNGLAILDMGDHSFGRPSRITARTYLGNAGVINIEREARMSGRLHNKGVMILASYLAGKYAQDRPLSLSASLTFEQLYDEVDGDSASGAELYALLSSLTGIPIKQSFAVTGSINQRGEVQAIGGVTRKIEGFFAICKARGLTGQHGVVIPASNVKHLTLDDEVVSAVREGLFHIYAVRKVDEAIELLTDVPAGEIAEDGNYPAGSIHSLVQERLAGNAEKLRGYSRAGGNKELKEPVGPEELN